MEISLDTTTFVCQDFTQWRIYFDKSYRRGGGILQSFVNFDKYKWFILDIFLQVSESSDKPKYHPILTWKNTVNRIPWGVIVLLGGGFALASATSVSIPWLIYLYLLKNLNSEMVN